MIQWIVSSSLLVLVLIALRFLLRGRIKPKLQYALWAIALARLLLPIQFGSTPISIENTVEKAPIIQEMEIADQVIHFDYHLDGFATGYYTYTPDADSNPEQEIPNAPVPELFTHEQADRITHLRSTKQILMDVWVGGMLLMGAAFLVSNLIFAGRLRKSRKLLEKGKLPIYVTEATETPCLFGLFRPAIYLTPAVAEDEQHKTYAVAHETTHYHHADGVWAVLRCLCLVLHWYNPLVWWAAVLSRADGEIACDESTIATLGEQQRADYGRVLIDLTCRKTTDLLRTATTMTGSAKGLKERIKMIAKRPKMAIYTLIAVLLVAAIAIACTFTGGNAGKDPTDPTADPTAPTTETTDPSKIEEKLPDTIVGTALTAEELANFTQMFTRTGEEYNWYNTLLACEFSRPEDINVRRLFNNGFYPMVEITDADQAFLNSLSWYQPGGPVEKLPVDQMEDVLKTYLGLSLHNVNRHGLESLEYFADGSCYFVASAGALGMQKFEMIDGKREEDGTIWLMSRQKASVDGGGIYKTHDLRIVCLKPQPENPTAPYRVQSCQWLMYVGYPYPQTIDPSDCVPYIYTGEPVTINGKQIVHNHRENYLYVYRHSKGWSEQIGWAPVHSFTTDDSGHIYFVVQDQSQVIRCNYASEQMQVVYTTSQQIKSVTYAGNNRIQVEQDKFTVVYNMTTGRVESEKYPDLTKVDFLQNVAGTAMTDSELAYFTELFSQTKKEGEINWYNILLDCGWDFGEEDKGFTIPENVNMKRLFNNGFGDISHTSNWTAAELTFVQSFQPGYPENSKDYYRLPADKMNKVLQDYLGITLERSNKVRLDKMNYFADTNCYFSSPAGAVGEPEVKMLAGKKAANGMAYLICTTDTSSALHSALLVAVAPAPEGAARPYYVRVCAEVNDAADVTSILQPANPEKDDELKNIAGTSLTDSELAYFTDLFAGTTQKNGEINWYNYLLSCGRKYDGYSKGFMVPEDVNLNTLFNNGCRDANTTRNWTAEEVAFVQGFYPEYTQYSSMVYRLPVEGMNKALQDYLGITLEQSNKVWLDRMHHFPATNCYFVQRSGMVGEQNVEMLAGKKAADGTVHLLCITDAAKTQDSKLVVSLVPAPEGSAKPYWVQACVQIKGGDDPSSVQQPTVQEYSKVKNGYVPFIYNGRPLMTATARIDTTNLEVGKLYICDPTTYKIYLVADEKIACFDATSEHLYYVIEGGNQVIRCDYGDSSAGENKVVVYSTVGTITSIDHYGTHANDILLLVEDGKTAVLYRPETGEHKQLFTAHMIYDIRYENNAKRLDKKKSGHVVFWMGLPKEDSESDSWLYFVSSGEETWMDKPDDDTAGYGGWSDRYATGIFDGREFYSYAPMPADTSWFQKDFLYTYDRLTGIYYQLSDSPVVRYCTTLKHDYMFFTDGSQMFRCDHKGGNIQLVYTSSNKITFADYKDGNELVIVEDESKVYLYNFATGEKELLMEQPYVEDAFYYEDSSKLDGRKKGRAVWWHGKTEGDPRINQYVYYIELDEMYNPPWL